MSRGPGRIERAIEAAFDAEPDNAFTIEDLCERVYSGVNRIEKKHRVAVLRAATKVLERRDSLDQLIGERLGRQLVMFRKDNVMSYAMARLKSEEHYRSKDGRAPEHWIKSEAELRAEITERHRHLIQPGGAWHDHVQSWIAEIEARRVGDEKRLAQVLAKREASNAAVMRVLRGAGPS